METLKDRRILLGVSGSIAIVKSLEILSRLKKLGAEVRVVMTPDATHLVPPVTWSTLTEHPVYHTMWGAPTSHEMEHLSWSKWGELLLVAPATANTLAAMAHGLAGNALTCTALAFQGPIVVAPAMNPAMWEAEATQANVRVLSQRGVDFVGPSTGLMACGDHGAGRLAEPDEIVAAVELLLLRRSASPLSGKRVLMTVGPTREPLDAVRFLTNGSTGRMGYALAREAAKRGARVTVVAGPTPLPPPNEPGIDVVRVTTAVEMAAATLQRLEQADVCIFTAAVADFRPAEPSLLKRKKTELAESDSGEGPSVRLLPNPDIAAEAGRLNVPGQLRVGFAAETHDVERFAREKLARKNLHLIVANDVAKEGVGFGTETNAVTVYKAGTEALETLSLRTKDMIARGVMDIIERHPLLKKNG